MQGEGRKLERLAKKLRIDVVDDMLPQGKRAACAPERFTVQEEAKRARRRAAAVPSRGWAGLARWCCRGGHYKGRRAGRWAARHTHTLAHAAVAGAGGARGAHRIGMEGL